MMLTAERLRELLEYNPENGVFRWRVTKSSLAEAGSVAGYMEPRGYIQIGIDGRSYRAHRLAWLYMHGCWPPDQVDHHNRKKADLRWCNLRLATPAQNQANKAVNKNNTSGCKGVSWQKNRGKWQVRIRIHGVRMFLGLFDSLEEAAAAYDEAAHKWYGEFACT